jgi:hypothetical protein
VGGSGASTAAACDLEVHTRRPQHRKVSPTLLLLLPPFCAGLCSLVSIVSLPPASVWQCERAWLLTLMHQAAAQPLCSRQPLRCQPAPPFLPQLLPHSQRVSRARRRRRSWGSRPSPGSRCSRWWLTTCTLCWRPAGGSRWEGGWPRGSRLHWLTRWHVCHHCSPTP